MSRTEASSPVAPGFQVLARSGSSDRPAPVGPDLFEPLLEAAESRRAVPRQRALDGIRGLAVLAVLVYHSGIGVVGGYLGVSTFFTLSGFVVTSLLLAEHRRRGTISLTAFWGRRFRRLMPAALVTLVLCSGLVAGAGRGEWHATFTVDGLAALGYVSNWRFIASGQAYQALFAMPSPVQHFWSLAIEEQVYLVLPLVVVAVLRIGRGRPRVLAGAFAALLAASAALPAMLGWSGDRVYLGSDTRAAEVLAGCLLAAVLAARDNPIDGTFVLRPRRGRWLLDAVALLAALAVGVAWFTVPRHHPLVAGGGLVAFAALSTAVILGALVPGSITARLLSSRPLARLGLISYSVYLYHWPLYLALRVAWPDATDAARLAVGLPASVVLGGLSFRFVERPFQLGTRATDGRRHALRLLAPAACITVVAALVAAPTSGRGTDEVAAITLDLPGGALVSNLTEASLDPNDATAPVLSTPGSPTTVTTAVPAPAPVAEPILGPPPVKTLTRANRPLRLLVVGDSAAAMMLNGLAQYGTKNRVWTLSNHARIGCGLGRGGERFFRGQVTPVPPDCADFAQDWPAVLRKVKPDVVLVSNAFWDLIDRRFIPDGPWHHVGQPAFDAYMRAEMAEASDVLGRSGATVVWLDHAPLGAGRNEVAAVDEPANEPARAKRMNELLAEVAAERPFVRVVPYARFMATRPGGPFELRPDGLHVDEPGSRTTVEWLGPELVDAYWQDQTTR